MHIQSLFKPLEELENNLALLYGRFSKAMQQADSEAAMLFYRLSLDEKSHLNLVRYQKRLVQKNPESFQEVDISAEEVRAVASKVDEWLWSKHFCTVEEAVYLALEFEESAAEQHHRSAIVKANMGIANLMESLAASDRHHLAILRDFAWKRHLVPLRPPTSPQ